MKQLMNADIANDNNFKSFKYEAKLLKYKAIIAVPLKYLSNFGRSLEMPLINCKVEIKLLYCVLSAAGTDNFNGNDDDSNIIFTIKETKLYVPVGTLSARDN